MLHDFHALAGFWRSYTYGTPSEFIVLFASDSRKDWTRDPTNYLEFALSTRY